MGLEVKNNKQDICILECVKVRVRYRVDRVL